MRHSLSFLTVRSWSPWSLAWQGWRKGLELHKHKLRSYSSNSASRHHQELYPCRPSLDRVYPLQSFSSSLTYLPTPLTPLLSQPPCLQSPPHLPKPLHWSQSNLLIPSVDFSQASCYGFATRGSCYLASLIWMALFWGGWHHVAWSSWL